MQWTHIVRFSESYNASNVCALCLEISFYWDFSIWIFGGGLRPKAWKHFMAFIKYRYIQVQAMRCFSCKIIKCMFCYWDNNWEGANHSLTLAPSMLYRISTENFRTKKIQQTSVGSVDFVKLASELMKTFSFLSRAVRFTHWVSWQHA